MLVQANILEFLELPFKGRHYASPVEIVAEDPRPGTADLCFIAETPLQAVAAHLKARGVAIEMGPLERSGAAGTLRSVYCRDPDGNLIEVSNYGTG